jgi:uncharacterized protein (UPF0548 family)
MSSTTPIRIKALDQLEFDGAAIDGYVYGTLSQYVENQWQTFYVFAWLGTSVDYQITSRDDQNAVYKKFVGCTVRVATTQEKLDAGDFLGEESGLTVVIYW